MMSNPVHFQSKPSEPGFFDHLEILRKKLILTFIFLIICFAASFIWIDSLVQFLRAPLNGFSVKLVYLKPHEKFMAYMKVAFFSSFFAAIPFFLFQIGHFVMPALKQNEKKYFLTILLLIFIFFIGGSVFSYLVLTPFVFQFFINFSAGDSVEAFWSVGEYYHLMILFIFLIGAAFQFPFVLFFLMKLRIVSIEKLIKMRRVSIIIIFIIAGIITPPDIYSQLVVGSIMYLLYELTILIGKKWIVKKIDVTD